MSKNKKNTQKKKMGPFGKLYIATALLTILGCAIVVGVTVHISNSFLRLSNTSPISIPTPMPVDAFLKKQQELYKSESTPRPITKTESSSDTEETEQPLPKEESIETESLAVGLFENDTDLTLRAPLSGSIALAYSGDRLIKSKTMGDWRTHNGIDISADISSAVCAAADGTVVRAGYEELLGYTVVLAHDGGYETVYANMTAANAVSPSQKVKAGDYLGAVGDSAVFEKLDGTHLHFELRKNGRPIDPSEYLQ